MTTEAHDGGAIATNVQADEIDTPNQPTVDAPANPEPAPAADPIEEPTSHRRRNEMDLDAIAERAAAARDSDMRQNNLEPVDTRDAPADAPAPSPAPAGEAAPAPEPPPAPEPAPAPEPPPVVTPEELAELGRRQVTLTIDGQPVTRTVEQILRDAQKAGAADKRLKEATDLLAQARETVARVDPAPAPADPSPTDETIRQQAKSVIEAFFTGDEDAATERLTQLLARPSQPAQPAIDPGQIVQQVKQSLDDESALQAVLAEYPQVSLNAYTQQAADSFFNEALAEGLSRQDAFRTAAERTYEAFGYTRQTPAAPAPATTHASQTQERKARLDVPVGRNVSAAKVEQTPVESSIAARAQAVAEIAQRGRPIRGR